MDVNVIPFEIETKRRPVFVLPLAGSRTGTSSPCSFSALNTQPLSASRGTFRRSRTGRDFWYTLYHSRKKAGGLIPKSRLLRSLKAS